MHSIIPFPVTTRALVFGGDWACAHGDPASLAEIARQLAKRVGEPLQLELVELAQLCRSDSDRASRRWPLLREQIIDFMDQVSPA